MKETYIRIKDLKIIMLYFADSACYYLSIAVFAAVTILVRCYLDF